MIIVKKNNVKKEIDELPEILLKIFPINEK